MTHIEQMSIEGKLKMLSVPFEKRLISKKPKPTKDQGSCDSKLKVKCKECGGFHHPQVIHLDYVGHAALTDRLLSVDAAWTWEPMAYKDGLPAFDASGGLWIKLTILGITRIGYGHAAANPHADIGSREKEVIGDALRNAAMRFGCALELWHKGDLHSPIEENAKPEDPPKHDLASYPEDQFKSNLPAWIERISKKKQTPEQIINMISTKYTLSDVQKQSILNIGVENADS